MLDHAHWLKFAMNAIMDLIKEDALFAEEQEFPMLFTVKNVFNRKKIEMVVLR